MHGRVHERGLAFRAETSHPAHRRLVRVMEGVETVPGRARRICGAWSRSRNRSCRGRALANGRCKNHGGLVRVVLRSPQGVERAAQAVRALYADWRAELGLPPGWRYRKVRMSAAEWLARQKAKPTEELRTKTPSEPPCDKP